MANRIRLEAGTYRATGTLCLALYQGTREVEYRTVAAGETFDVPTHVNHYWSAVKYYPDLGDAEPRFEQLPAAQ